MKKFLFFLLFFLAVTSVCSSEDLPEFYGCYLKNTQGDFIELPENRNKYTTGWFVKKQKSNDNSLQGMSKMFQDNDMFRALGGASNIKSFISGLSEIELQKDSFKGIVVYSEVDIGDVKIYKLTNEVIPRNAIFIEYKGPEPIDRDNMWFLGDVVATRARPIKEDMYYVAPREPLSPGCYSVNIGSNIYDFEIQSLNMDNPLIGKWVGGMYLKERKFLGGETYFIPFDMFIDEIKSNGEVIGTYKKYKPGRTEIVDEGDLTNMTIDLKSGNVLVVMEDEGKEGSLYGKQHGKVSSTHSQKCVPGKAKLTMEFDPYEKYKKHDYLKKYKLSWLYERE